MIAVHPLFVISAFIPIVPLGIGLYAVKGLGKDRRLLLILMGLAFIVQFIAFLYFLNRENNLFIYHIYMPLEFIILGHIYKIWLINWWKSQLLDVIIWAYVLFSAVNTFFFQKFDTVNSNALLVGGVLLMIFSLAFFYRILDEMKLKSLEKSPEFWINSSILLYYSGSIIVLGMNHLIAEKSDRLIEIIYMLHSVINIIHYLLFGIGLWLKVKE
ncbi:MAG: hypothetical protein R8P61_17700 [Bacteroidia bacterium]|nr:hypothetical protein [Bacteroidia bacterium]